MSEDKHTENDPERTLVTLEQLSQTIEVMTSVVNRLRQHLSEQLQAQMTRQESAALEPQAGQDLANSQQAETEAQAPSREEVLQAQKQEPQKQQQQRESFVVEIRQQDPEPVRKNNKTLH
jgi:flagellar biosynthesis component FlhA